MRLDVYMKSMDLAAFSQQLPLDPLKIPAELVGDRRQWVGIQNCVLLFDLSKDSNICGSSVGFPNVQHPTVTNGSFHPEQSLTELSQRPSQANLLSASYLTSWSM